MLGDKVEAALSSIGITKERVERWLGGPCGCDERQQKLNQLGIWAHRLFSHRTLSPREELDGIIEDELNKQD
jgi:hypothetical protein